TGYTVTLAGVNSPPITINTNKLPVTVQDNKGKLYTIDKNGKITPAGQVSGALLAGKGPDQLNQLNTDKGTVTFVAHPDQVYVFDPYQDVYKKSSIFDHEYETLTGSYRVGNKFLTTGSTDKIIAKLSGLADGIDEDSIHFITGKGIEFAAKKTASLTYEITLLSGPAGDAQELYAIYRDSDAAKKNPNASSASFTYSLGKLDIATYEPKTLNVKLVPVGNAQVDKTQISTRLNQIYNPIGITWTVDVASSFPITQDWDVDSSGSLNITGAGKYNQYSNEMKLLNAAYLQSNSGLNASSPYLFVFSTSPTSGPDEQGRGILGDMLRNKQFGYIFLPNNNDIGQTAAHELGHGVFHLNHTFDTQYYLSQGDLPANLMDYSGGDQFAKLQWDAVYVPSLVIGIFDKEGDAQLNSTELDYVKFLFKIRNANKNNTSFALSSFSDPFQGLSRDRIFIAGQIFPSIKINYDFKTGMNVNAKNISLKTINNLQCIVVDDKIQLYLPADLPTIKYSQILLNFLTNVSTTDITNSLGGEFLDYDTYKLVVGDASIPLANWDGKDGSWLKSDREGLTTRFKNACDYIIKNKITGRLGPFLQIAAFYDYVGMKSISVGHQIRWYKGASKLVHALGGQSEDDRFGLEGGNMAIANDVELILNELNLKICDYAITQFYELFYGQYAKTPLIGDAAYQFDKQFVETEQGVIAVPIYSKTSASTLSTFQDMADKDPNGTHGAGAMALSKVTPGFDDFDPPALVTDVQFRIDLPLLMLYLDIHKPTANSFKNHLESDGTLNNEYKTILQPYADALK
ncbi:MAG TPA: hypothetical protein VK750_07390, partial [Cytophagaceae bacterium]|nr:hypothetical protein [Cytophagaceae bacterium]